MNQAISFPLKKEVSVSESSLLSSSTPQGTVFDDKFLDSEFLPIKSSLTLGSSCNPKFQTLLWKRASDMSVSPKSPLSPEMLSPFGLRLGLLDNPYFICALSILAEKPEILAKNFVKLRGNTPGLYCVSFNLMGEWKNILIDDFFPFDQHINDWAFTRSDNGEIWAQILEKAYAKMHNSFENIRIGNVPETMMDLTGACFEVINMNQEKGLWEKLRENFERGYFVYCSRKNGFFHGKQSQRVSEMQSLKDQRVSLSGSREDNASSYNIFGQRSNSGSYQASDVLLNLDSIEIMTKPLEPIDFSVVNGIDGYCKVPEGMKASKAVAEKNIRAMNTARELGIQKDYEYAIIDMREIKKEGLWNKKQQLLRIRNPWMKIEWNGEWAASSKKWAKKTCDELGFDVEAPQSSFWLNWEEFVEIFDTISVSKYEDTYDQTILHLKHSEDDKENEHTSVIRIICQKKGHAFLSVNQIDKRLIRNDERGIYKYSGCRIMIGKIVKNENGKELEFVDAKYAC